ncbi:Steroid C26-monooxygenase [Rubripirellula obstinata]|uniref:Steroid C26-monooxygenase n=1 Tax=Rubripirellula obstinata TaxID=406547 RepID=A0A5B1CL96_9BACT|nr:cytochrome P450 [Rubripirellula obstinata]KAA1261112.1 Steroid C26-monooxygenase [Rubripirellula obstinata]
MPEHIDPFREDRQQSGVKTATAEGKEVPLVLRLQDIRKTCKDTKTFSNDNPMMIVLHSEAHVRNVRQLPIETDPPEHTDYRALVEPIYRKPQQPEYQAEMRKLVAGMVKNAAANGEVEVVREFAVPLQSRGLAQLLGLPQSEAEIWIGWGVHIFRDAQLGSKGSEVDKYIFSKYEEMQGSDGDDFFSILNRIDFRDRKLTMEEKHGYANMAFAGGRDTVINTISSILVYLAEHPEAIEFLREDEMHITTATEEFVRYVSPVTIISRTCPHATEVLGHQVEAGERIGLCWPSANRDETIFDNPDEVVLDRAPNPHVGFGFGAHNCLGQHQARLIVRSLLHEVCDQLDKIEFIEAVPEIEEESSYSRQVGYKSARIKFVS